MKAFVHGNPETAAIWSPLVDALARRGIDDVVLLSPPGFGAPTPKGFVPHRENYVRWLVGELDALGGEVDLVGHDWGAGHVCGLLALRPELVRTWTIDCGGLLHPDYVWHDAAQSWQTADVGEQMVQGMIATEPDTRAELFAGLGMSVDAAGRAAAALDDEMGRCILGLYRSAAQPAMADLGRELVARAASLPVGLIIVPTDDPYVGTAAMAGAVAGSLGAASVTLPGRGHWWMFDDLDPVVDALVTHWAGA